MSAPLTRPEFLVLVGAVAYYDTVLEDQKDTKRRKRLDVAWQKVMDWFAESGQ